jgi:hypothetical protein
VITRASAAASRPSGHMPAIREFTRHVVFRDERGHILQLAFTPGSVVGWELFDLTAATRCPPATGHPYLTFWFDNRAKSHQQVFYRGLDDHVHLLEHSLDITTWEHLDLSRATGAVAAAGDPMGYEFKAAGYQCVLYRGQDQHVHELRGAADVWGQWSHEDLTATSGAPPAAGEPFGYLFEMENRQHVIYRQADGFIIEIAHTLGSSVAWEHYNLTLSLELPPTTGNPHGYVTHDRQRILFRGEGGAVHELSYQLGTAVGWEYTNLTAVSGAPPAVKDPFGYFAVGESSAQVLFLGHNGQVYELSSTYP